MRIRLSSRTHHSCRTLWVCTNRIHKLLGSVQNRPCIREVKNSRVAEHTSSSCSPSTSLNLGNLTQCTRRKCKCFSCSSRVRGKPVDRVGTKCNRMSNGPLGRIPKSGTLRQLRCNLPHISIIRNSRQSLVRKGLGDKFHNDKQHQDLTNHILVSHRTTGIH